VRELKKKRDCENGQKTNTRFLATFLESQGKSLSERHSRNKVEVGCREGHKVRFAGRRTAKMTALHKPNNETVPNAPCFVFYEGWGSKECVENRYSQKPGKKSPKMILWMQVGGGEGQGEM